MSLCIILTKIKILTILLLCIRIPSSYSNDLVNENSVINSQTVEDNQTIIVHDESTLQLNDSVLSDTNSETLSPTNLSIVETDVPTISTENIAEVVDDISLTTISPLIIENHIHDDQHQTLPTTTKKNLLSINSFEEWKQQQLQTHLLKKDETNNRNSVTSDTTITGVSKGTSASPANIQQLAPTIGSSKKAKLRKNFASGSCGAKILAHNVEAQNVGSILSSSPDEYMLNPCNAKIWFVFELCESIRILDIEIANFELFSSVPKTFRVSASDRYPTKDWHRHYLGTFNASYNRTIQSFQPIEYPTYLKYVKFELIDFHGHEHYCPLSVVRIHGSNVEDELMTMEENTNLNDLKSSTNIQNENEDDDDDDENNNESNDQQVGGIISSAIFDLAKRVFRRQTIRDTSSTTTIPIIETNVLKTNCHQSVLNGSITNDSINIWRRNETFKQCIAKFLHGLWSKFDTCTIYLSQNCFQLNYCCQCRLINSNKTQSSLNVFINPCGYYHILTSPFICKKEKFNLLNKTITDNINGELTQDFKIEKNLTMEKNSTGMIIDESVDSSDNHSLPNPNHILSNETQQHSITHHPNDQVLPNNDISNETTMVLETQIPSNVTNESASQSTIHEQIHMDVNIIEPLIENNHTDETVTSTTTASPILNNNNNNEIMAPGISSPWLKGMFVNTKSIPELFKIIDKIYFNLTLSNRYLEELSQHYVKKLDETQQTTDLLLNSSKAADEKLINLEEHLYKLQTNFDEMSNRLIKLEAWIPSILFIIFCLFIWCIWSTCRLFRLRRKIKNLTNEFENLKKLKQIENEREDDADEEEEDSPPPIICNGHNKRKLSTDSSDSNPTRSQRVPDITLSKITENGIHKSEQKIKGKSPHQTKHLLSLSTIHT